MPSKTKKQILLQYVAGIIAALTSAGFGCATSWSSPALSYLTSTKSHLPITKQQSDLIAAMLSVGSLLGYIMNAIIVDRMGAKMTLLIFSLPQITSWIMIILSENIMTIYIARFICGLGYACGSSALLIYLSEISNHKNRGIFLILIILFNNFGVLYTLLLGASLTYYNMNYSLLALPISFAVIFFFMPDSSYFHKPNKCNEETMKGLMNLQAFVEERSNESSASGLTVNERNIENTYKFSMNFRDSRLWKLLSTSSNRRALLIIGQTSFICVFSGSIPLIYFSQQIFKYSGSNFSPEISAIMVGGVKFTASLLSTLVVEHIKRKILLLYTGTISTIAILLVSIFLFLDENNMDVSSARWIPLFGVIIFECMVIMGAGSLFFIYSAELFATDVKSCGVAISKILLMILTFLALFKFQKIVDSLGISVVFFIFTICNAVGTSLLYVITPETKGKRINEIQDLLKAKSNFLC